MVCVYANFAIGEGKDWMRREDIRGNSDDEMVESVSKIKLMREAYEWLKEVRYAFMQSHNRISDGVYEIVYSNGVKLIVDYNNRIVRMIGYDFEKLLKV